MVIMFDLYKRSGENSDKGEQRDDEHQTEFHWLLKASVTSSVDAIAINYNPPTDWQGKVLEDAMAADFGWGSNVLFRENDVHMANLAILNILISTSDGPLFLKNTVLKKILFERLPK